MTPFLRLLGPLPNIMPTPGSALIAPQPIAFPELRMLMSDCHSSDRPLHWASCCAENSMCHTSSLVLSPCLPFFLSTVAPPPSQEVVCAQDWGHPGCTHLPQPHLQLATRHVTCSRHQVRLRWPMFPLPSATSLVQASGLTLGPCLPLPNSSLPLGVSPPTPRCSKRHAPETQS